MVVVVVCVCKSDMHLKRWLWWTNNCRRAEGNGRRSFTRFSSLSRKEQMVVEIKVEGFEKYLGSNLLRFRVKISYTLEFLLIVLGKPILFILIFHFPSFQDKLIHAFMYTWESQGVCKALGISWRADKDVPALMCSQLEDMVTFFLGTPYAHFYTTIFCMFLSTAPWNP